MGTINKKIEKEITFFMFENLTSKTLDDLIDFCSKYDDVLMSNINIDLSNNKPYKIELGINIGGSVMNRELKPNLFYFFKGKELNSVENVDEVVWW